MAGYSIFICYAHEDEAFKNALTRHLAGLKRCGLIDPWDDRCIEGGDEWRTDIEIAIDGCQLAVLLVSSAFIDSDFIYSDELGRLLERHRRDGIRLLPIIVKPCAWKYEKPIESLQVRPKDGAAMVTFPEDTGARDKAWVEIVEEIAGWAQQPVQAVAPPAAESASEGVGALIARLAVALVGDADVEVDEASRLRILGHPPAKLDQYRVARWAEWSQRRYAVDKRFTRLALLVDQGPEAQGARWQEQSREFQDLREVLLKVDDPALVVLGPPGCGKSTLLRRLELDLAVDALRAPAEGRISMFLPLSRYRAGDDGILPSPREWVAREWQRPLHRQLPPLAELLASGRLVLLLDAINEMPHASDADYGARIERWSIFLADLVRDAPGTRVVFSCRSLDYSAPLSCGNKALPHVRIKSLDDQQVQEFLRVYSPDHGTKLWCQLEGTSQLEVLRSPFYLKLLVELPLPDGALPKGRAGLFTHFVRQTLLREIEVVRNPLFQPDDLLSRRDYACLARHEWGGDFELAGSSPLFAALSTFAARLQARCTAGKAEHIRVKYADALHLLGAEKGEALLEAGAALQVLEVVRDEVFFVHQLLQEYFAGRAIAAAPRPELARLAWRAGEIVPGLDEILAGLADSDPLPAAPSSGWEESFMLAAAMSAAPENFVTALAEVNLPLAGRCAAQADVAVSESVRAPLQQQLLARSRDPEADLRARIAAGRSLGELGDPRFDARSGPHGRYLLPPLVRIAGGEYVVGSDDGRYQDEEPVHRVTLAGFSLGRFPVTNAEWRLFMEAGGYAEDRWWEGEAAKRWRRGEDTAEGSRSQWRKNRETLQGDPDLPQRRLEEGRITTKQAEDWEWFRDASDADFEAWLEENFPGGLLTQPAYWDDPAFNHAAQPVVGICWYEARAYCAWLSAQSGQAFRLPSEAEWEAAARGVAGRRYAWGEDFDAARCNALETHVRGTTSIGVFPAGDTPEGLVDMSGNVWDWTSSLYKPYRHAADDGREDAEEECPRVVRGGSWGNDRLSCRCASRNSLAPGSRDGLVGFRVCVAPPS